MQKEKETQKQKTKQMLVARKGGVKKMCLAANSSGPKVNTI
jgi:hypothetical protein